MTKEDKAHLIDPYEISQYLEVSISSAKWLTDTDLGAIALARRLAQSLDTAFNVGELKDVPALAARFTQILAQLHLTTETRIQGNKEEETNGLAYIADYLRVSNAAPDKSQAKSTNGRTGSH